MSRLTFNLISLPALRRCLDTTLLPARHLSLNMTICMPSYGSHIIQVAATSLTPSFDMFKIPCQKQLTLCNFLTVCGNTAIQKYQNAVKTSPIYLTFESNS
jgi:hypothetical protein